MVEIGGLELQPVAPSMPCAADARRSLAEALRGLAATADALRALAEALEQAPGQNY